MHPLFISIFAIFVLFIGCSENHTTDRTITTTTAASSTATPTASKTKPSNTASKPVLSDRGITIDIQHQNVASGETTCLDVNVQQFTDVVSMQYSLNWNPAELTFTEIKGFNLKDLSKANFGTRRAPEGKIAFSWYDQAIQGVTAADNTTIYQLCFQAKAAAGTKAKVQITEDPTVVEVTGKGSTFLKLFAETAYVTVQ